MAVLKLSRLLLLRIVVRTWLDHYYWIMLQCSNSVSGRNKNRSRQVTFVLPRSQTERVNLLSGRLQHPFWKEKCFSPPQIVWYGKKISLIMYLIANVTIVASRIYAAMPLKGIVVCYCYYYYYYCLLSIIISTANWFLGATTLHNPRRLHPQAAKWHAGRGGILAPQFRW